ncbi:MAG: LON peptidase substrate-binding domain-containing protein, partial [Bosea sp. (in: a-proteobacteria)]
MPMNKAYSGPGDCPEVIPVFPLAGALLLPRGQLPLNVFEPRYMAMIDDALKTHRVIGMIQPDSEDEGASTVPALYTVGCAGRITQVAETGDGRYVLQLTGISRFRVLRELGTSTPYRQVHADYAPYLIDFEARAGEDEVNRQGLIKALRDFAKVNDMRIDWKSVNDAPNEALVNALAMMSPFGPREKQALLEAHDLKTRTEVMIAITQIELARSGND